MSSNTSARGASTSRGGMGAPFCGLFSPGRVPAVYRYPPLQLRPKYRYSAGMKTEDQTEALERIETRVSPADRARIGAAAVARHESVARFVQRAALKEADDVLGREVDVTRMPVDQFEDLLAALDRPAEPIPEIVQLAASDRAFSRR
ncbi:unannotated protein [freshwater metagenome]|uniref:Unannotated protein n=1 Tax=freshwater metagenome TaxID=449393 RepID=A0A6J7J1X5_9ZZZZ